MDLWMGEAGICKYTDIYYISCFLSWVISNSLAKSSCFGDLVSFANFVISLPTLTMFPVFFMNQLWTLSTYCLIDERVYSIVIFSGASDSEILKERKNIWTLWNSLTNLLMTMKSSPAPNFNFMVNIRIETKSHWILLRRLPILSQLIPGMICFTFDLIPFLLKKKKKKFTQLHY